MNQPKVPEQCKSCISFNHAECLCKIYEQLPGEYGRESIQDCPSFVDQKKEDELSMLAQYIDEDPEQLVESKLTSVVNKILSGYEEKFKIMVIGVARRKIKAMVRMVDVIDILLDKLSNREELDNMTAGQSIRLLSELNNSINNDLAFVMKLVNPETQMKDLQMFIDNRSIVNVNGASNATELKANEILNMTSVSRDKIRDAFDALLNNVNQEEGYLDIHESSQEDKEDIGDL